MIGVLPPQYIRGAAGFFLSEAATQSIHAQFIKHGGRTYGGYADLARGSRKIWTIADLAELESRAAARTPTPGWFRQEEHRVGKEGVSMCRSRLSPYH